MGYVLIDETMLTETEQKAVQVTRLIESNQCDSIAKACKIIGISRSSYYKNQHIYPVNDDSLTIQVSIGFADGIHALRGDYNFDKTDIRNKKAL